MNGANDERTAAPAYIYARLSVSRRTVTTYTTMVMMRGTITAISKWYVLPARNKAMRKYRRGFRGMRYTTYRIKSTRDVAGNGFHKKRASAAMLDDTAVRKRAGSASPFPEILIPTIYVRARASILKNNIIQIPPIGSP